jgi:pSer/pThr/pTyr-binding forkhead associated (FHA) protein
MKPRVVVVSGRLNGRTFEVPPGEFVIGRLPDCQLAVDSPIVARHHCMLLNDGSVLTVRDLRSPSGTWVNQEPIRENVRILAHGDTIQVGRLIIRVDLESSNDGRWHKTANSPVRVSAPRMTA